jgi:hypothetical protein
MMIKRILPLALFSIAMLSVEARAAEDLVNRRVSGKVVATDADATPNTIVVKVKTGKKDLIVGAAVTDKTVIRKRGGAAGLKDIRPGESVELSYTRDGSVVATSITAK